MFSNWKRNFSFCKKNEMKFSAVAIYLISHVILHFMYRLIAEQARQEHIFSTLKIN